MSNDSTKAQRAQIFLGSMPMLVYMLPDESYRMNADAVVTIVGEPIKSLTDFYGCVAISGLPDAVTILSETSEILTGIPSKVAVHYWSYLASRDNLTAKWIIDDLLLDAQEVFESSTSLDIRGERNENTLSELKSITDYAAKNKNIKSSKQIEKQIQTSLAKLLQGETEVWCPVGRIDVLTESQVIEVKVVSHWKAGVGQLFAYGAYYPDREKRLHLFGGRTKSLKKLIEQHLNPLGIAVTWEPQ